MKTSSAGGDCFIGNGKEEIVSAFEKRLPMPILKTRTFLTLVFTPPTIYVKVVATSKARVQRRQRLHGPLLLRHKTELALNHLGSFCGIIFADIKVTKEEYDMIMLDINKEESVKKDCDFEKLVDSLLSVLAKEVEVYGELQAIIQEERGTLRRPSLDLISDSNSKKETCILKARMLEEVRANIVKKIARHIGKEEKDLNISLLACHVRGRQRTALKAQQKILMALIGAIKETNKMNRDLLDYSLSYVRDSVNFINQIMCTGADYVNTGKLKTSNRNGIMLCKEG